MLRRFWRWLKKFFQGLFGKKPAPTTVTEPPRVEPQFTDADYERFFFQLLAEVNEESWSQGQVNGFLDRNNIKVADLVIWLRGFGERLLASPAENEELARRLMRLRGFGELGDVGYELGVRLLERRGFNREDVKHAKEGEEKNHNINSEFNINWAESWLNLGNEQFKVADFIAAMASYDRAIEAKSDNHEAWYNRGLALGNLGKYEEAIASYDKAVKIKPDLHEAWHNRGNALGNLGKDEEAIASFDQALEIKADDYEAWFNRGVALDNLGKYEEAILSFDKVLEINPDDHEAWFNQGVALFYLGKHEEAIASFDKVLEINPDDHEAWFNRGVALKNLEKHEEAIASYDQAVKINSDYYEAWDNRGVALGNLGKYEEAILSFNKALQINSDYYQAWKNQGIALNNLRKYEEAILSYDKALQIKPDYYQAWINRGITAGNSISCDSFLSLSSSLAKNNPQLNKRGYKGRLTSYEEGLKYCQKSTHPEGWGRLHQYIGNAHYYQAKSDSYPHAYWRKAVTSYNEALTTLTALDFPELHLEVLQDLILVFLSLGETSKAEEIQRQGTDVLRILLDKCESPTKKQQLNYKFAAFQQITVDIAVQSGNWCAALELAEKGKNTCLSWLYEDWSGSPKLAEIKKLLNPNSAIIYWHLSNYALHTFILKYNAEPIIINSSVSPVKRLDDFEKWVKNWNEQYSNFRKGEKQEDKKLNTSWGDNLPSMLQQLGKILDISTIVNIINDKPCRDVTCNVSTNMEENSKIQNLILIPHRDLHRFPIHALFPDDFTITYLPSAQVGISLKLLHPNSINQIDQLPLLSVGYPDSKGFDILPQAEIESAAINQLFNHPESKCISGQAATNKELKAALPQNYNIFHFTGHSTYNFYNPKYSKLVLSGEESLTLAEILQIENLKQYKLVCLSACETAITSNQTITAEYVGLVSAFLSQGVANVVSTLWTVTDESSAFFMIYFYWQLKKGHSPAIALKKAQKWLRNLTFSKLERIYRVIFAKLSVDEKPLRPFIRKRLYQIEQMELAQKQTKPFAAPYYWAGFIITGGQN